MTTAVGDIRAVSPLPQITARQMPKLRQEILRATAVQVQDSRRVAAQLRVRNGRENAAVDDVEQASLALVERADFCQLYLASESMLLGGETVFVWRR